MAEVTAPGGVIERNIQPVAWLVLVAGLVCFVALAAGVPWLGLRYRAAATVAERATVECRAGSCVLWNEADDRVLTADDGAVLLAEGRRVVTDGSARAFVRFFDGSTLSIEPNAVLTLERMRRPRFSEGTATPTWVARIDPLGEATTHVSAGATWSAVERELHTPHGNVRLAPEAKARLELDPARLHVVGDYGMVTVSDPAGQAPVTLARNERTEVQAGRRPDRPTDDPENVLANPNLERRQEDDAWTPEIGDVGQVASGGQVALRTTTDGRTVLRFRREGSGGEPLSMVYKQGLGTFNSLTRSWTGINVAEARTIAVTGTLRVRSQSLPGGGALGVEYPLILRLIVKDQSGEEKPWEVGFYAVAPDEDGSYRTLDERGRSLRVPLDTWFTFDSGNLLEREGTYSFARQGIGAPVQLLRFEVKASGHDLESELDRVAVLVK